MLVSVSSQTCFTSFNMLDDPQVKWQAIPWESGNPFGKAIAWPSCSSQGWRTNWLWNLLCSKFACRRWTWSWQWKCPRLYLWQSQLQKSLSQYMPWRLAAFHHNYKTVCALYVSATTITITKAYPTTRWDRPLYISAKKKYSVLFLRCFYFLQVFHSDGMLPFCFRSFDVLFGDCPYCSEPVAVKVNNWHLKQVYG